MSTSARQQRRGPGPHSKICNRFTRPFPTVARRGCSRKRVTRFTSPASFVDRSLQPWSRVSPALTEADQPWLLSEAGLRLRALGRLTEAVEPMRAGLEMCIKQERWNNAAISARNLAQLELSLGEVA